ncbi:hypothetical protein CKM354_001155000 [Cercospora kikuchii]|uniref:Pisatin demethylase n=1 Tax=Cercospora kikuchii TaxID=84275 RepID=A0A9P3CSG8_9PEZI|nr:uncharacterized protein CKM354_001155000 [Cercospora kikuchii]GIZ48492.1 hypothetical protein CKM354_001155000 [Cercospora kikuchii]
MDLVFRLAVIVPVILILRVLTKLVRAIFDPLRTVPGPSLARFTRLWEVWQVCKGDFEKTNVELHRRYGPIVRLAPGRYSVCDQIASKIIYGPGSAFTKSNYYQPFGDPHGGVNLFTESSPQIHSDARRKVASLYSMTALVSCEPHVDHMNSFLCSRLTLCAEKGESIDIPTWMQYYAFDVIGEITLGKPFGMMERGYDSMGILKGIDTMLTYASAIGLVPKLNLWIHALNHRLSRPSPAKGLNDFAAQCIGDRKHGRTQSDRDDFLTKLMRLRDSGSISDAYQESTVASNITAGSDTTAITLSCIIYSLLWNPACAQELRNEIDTFAREGRISNPVTFKEAQNMPYLQAVIKEALRIHPATGQILARIVPASGAELCGYHVPAGTCVGINAWALHRDTSIWGPDADTFRPERWLEEGASVLERSFMPFGLGSRTCIGKNISLLEVAKVIPQIYRNFEIHHVNPGNPEVWETDNRFFVKQKFQCGIVQRTGLDF